MKLIKKETVLDMLFNTGHEGIEVNDALDSLGPANLINPPWKQDGEGFKPKKIAEYFGGTVPEIKKWAKELEGAGLW